MRNCHRTNPPPLASAPRALRCGLLRFFGLIRFALRVGDSLHQWMGIEGSDPLASRLRGRRGDRRQTGELAGPRECLLYGSVVRPKRARLVLGTRPLLRGFSLARA